MNNTEFKPNFREFERMANSEATRRVLTAKAEEAKAAARGLAEAFRITGHYADSFVIRPETVGRAEGFKNRHAAVKLVNTADYSTVVEWGRAATSRKGPARAHHVLGRVAASFGAGRD